MLKYNSTFTGIISSLDKDGYSVIKTGNTRIFIPDGVPGDEVIVKINKVKNNYATGEIKSIIKKSPDRLTKTCVDFEKGCGGCQWIHIDYKTQLYWKNRILIEELKNKLKSSINVESPRGMNDPFNFRNKMSMQIDKNGKPCFMMENSLQTINIGNCIAETKENNNVYDTIKNIRFPENVLQIHIRSNDNGESSLVFFVKNINSFNRSILTSLKKNIKNLTCAGLESYRDKNIIYGNDFLSQKINGISYKFPINGFFQTNYIQAKTLSEVVSSYLELTKNDNILDLYCGVGFFSLQISSHVNSVYGIENNNDSINHARENLGINNVKNVKFETADVKIGLKHVKSGLYNKIILDPPRDGCESIVLNEIIRIIPDKIVYVACSLSSLIRDAQILIKSGYRFKKCRIVDMFPHTYHMEIVAEFVKN